MVRDRQFVHYKIFSDHNAALIGVDTGLDLDPQDPDLPNTVKCGGNVCQTCVTFSAQRWLCSRHTCSKCIMHALYVLPSSFQLLIWIAGIQVGVLCGVAPIAMCT